MQHTITLNNEETAMITEPTETERIRVLLVDDHEVETERTDDFSGVAGRRFQKRTDELLAGQNTLAED